MFGGICWYCHWGWPEPVMVVYCKALAALDGDSRPLEFGPAHIVWSDENFEDGSVDWCLQQIAEHAEQYELTAAELAIVKQSLEELKAIPQAVRCCQPDAYDGDHPENFPPPAGVVMVRR